jgi:hypothetical protein
MKFIRRNKKKQRKILRKREREREKKVSAHSILA